MAANPEIEQLANAVTALAAARKRIPLSTLLRETALNILILSRIASNRIPDRVRREEMESAADHLVTQLRYAAWNSPVPVGDGNPPGSAPQA
ncbi:hypothetical protein [Glycomyces sp. YM15]|uniref:hypothetical protein n=1 Tax=Glycomyces sp. YM15 TaxID=2800446 RepID=UPI0019664B67|nr:hypothetical protein [Glycomyces sp. YM15]